MPERKASGEEMPPSNKCSCCPYGFHIDRDFVRYCDSLYNTAQLDKLRQHKRERRKEKKSVESYLGLGGTFALESDTKSTEITHNLINNDGARNAATLPHDLYLNSDGLKSAMLDFEDTWQKSLKKSCSSSDIIEKKNGFKPICVKPLAIKPEDRKELFMSDSNVNRSRRSSTSSDSSQSTAISSVSVPVASDASMGLLSPDHMSSSVHAFSKPCANSVHPSTGLNKTVLTNIREQMAASLKRMRELEEQVKTIPVLQVKVYSLTEERKTLLNQLKLNQCSPILDKSLEGQKCLEKQLKRLENEGIMSPTLSRKCLSQKLQEEDLSSPGIASCLDANITKRNFIEKEIIPHLKMDEPKNLSMENHKNMKNVATSCTVLTRDIGIGYVPSKYKSVGVGSDVTFKELINSYKSKKDFDFTSVSSESLESDSESPSASDACSRSFHSRYLNAITTKNYTTSSIPSKYCINSSTNTDIKYFCNKSVNTISPMTSTTEKTTKHKSTSASPTVSSKYIQTLDKKVTKNVSLQTMLEPKVEVVTKRDACIGDSNISDTVCSKCKVVKKSIGVGDFQIKSVVCDKCSSLQPHSQISTSTLHKSNCENCVLRQTETVGVGDYDVNNVNCENCNNMKPDNVQQKERRSIGNNTTTEISNNLSTIKTDMHICDKCSATIHSVAQGFAANTADSKIPKPNLKLPIAGKTNYMKLTKLKTQEFKSMKGEAPTRRDGCIVSKDNIHQKNVVIKRIDLENRKTTTTTTTFESKTFVKQSKESNELDQSPDSTVLPDFTNLPVLPHKKKELSKEVKAACKVLNDYLQKPERGGEKKTMSSLTIIQNEWFRVANQKKADPLLIEDYLDAFEEFSRLLLHKVVNLSDNNGNTALHYAISYGNFDVVSILIDSKVCDVNKKNKAGYTSIMLVALADMKNDAHHYVVQRLFSIGDINCKATQNGQTALMLAVSHGKKDIVKMLLDAGAEVNLQDKDGSTALMCAAEHGHIEIVKLLLSHPDCDPTMVDSDDCNALAIAMEAGYKDIGLLIYTNMNFSRGSSPYSTLKARKRSTPRSTPPPRTPTLRTPPLPSPSARSTNSIPSSFYFPS